MMRQMAGRTWRWIRQRRRGAWLVAAAVTVAALLLVGVVVLPPRLIDTAGLTGEARLRAENDLRSTLVTLLGGVIVAIGAVVGILNFRETSRQNRAILDVQRRGQMADRFTRAIEQLGQSSPEKLDVRIGAAYALEQIALDSTDLNWPVIEVLAAYLREHTRRQVPHEASNELSGFAPAPADIQAIATVIGRRRWVNDQPTRRLNLVGARLEGVNLSGAYLAGADLRNAHLERANLSGANLDGANAIGAWFTGADLSGGHLEAVQFRDTSLLQRAEYSEEAERAANRYVAQLGDASLCSAQLGGADLHGAQLAGADLTGAWLDGADLSDACLERAHMYLTRLEDANLERANLCGVGGLVRAQLRSSSTCAGTILPDYLAARQEDLPESPS
jgi:hypothetical protein